jgi:hypothetical protein
VVGTLWTLSDSVELLESEVLVLVLVGVGVELGVELVEVSGGG